MCLQLCVYTTLAPYTCQLQVEGTFEVCCEELKMETSALLKDYKQHIEQQSRMQLLQHAAKRAAVILEDWGPS